MLTNKKIAVLGGCSIGSALSILLARKGFHVDYYEKSRSKAQSQSQTNPQINLGISQRGVKALVMIDEWVSVLEQTVALNGRTIHNRNGSEVNHQYGKQNEHLYSIRTEIFEKILQESLSKYSSINRELDAKIQNIDLKNTTVRLEREGMNIEERQYCQIFIADDSFKLIKKQLIFQKGFKYNQDFSSFGYIEANIPSSQDNEFQLNPLSIHRWTNDDYHIIAFPNKDKSFACNIFIPLQGIVSFENIQTKEDLHKFIQTFFPTLQDLVKYEKDEIKQKNVGLLYDHKCFPWVFNNICLFGDAAHHIFPYYGQAINTGLEDCTLLSKLIDYYNADWQTITSKFQEFRKPNTDAVSDWAKEKFNNIKFEMFDKDFQEKKAIINYLSDNYQDLFLSSYQLIEFSHIEFQKAINFKQVEDEIVRQIRMIPNYERIVESQKKDSIIRHILKNFVGKFKVETTAVEIISQLGVLSKNQEVILLPNIGQFEVNTIQNCTISSKQSLDQILEDIQQNKATDSIVKTKQGQELEQNSILNGTQIGLCVEIELNVGQISISLKQMKEAFDQAILKSLKQCMKNINNIYKCLIIKVVSGAGQEVILQQDVYKWIKENGFLVIALNHTLQQNNPESLNHNHLFLNEDGKLIIERINLSEISLGAYIVLAEIPNEKGHALPCIFKLRKILNAELIDIYAHRKGECYYNEYLCVDELVGLMRNRTEYLEEKLFIRVHQINELAINQSIITLEELIKIFKYGEVIEKITTIQEYMNQILSFFQVQIQTNYVLCHMSTHNFLYGFRSALGTASGVQSFQFYILQLLLGLNKDKHILSDPVKILHLRETDIQKIKAYWNCDNLFKVIQDWLLEFYQETSEITQLEQDNFVMDAIKDCKDFSKEIALSVVYLFRHQELIHFKILEQVLKFEDSFLAFLDSHIVLVDHHLGDKRGTSQSSGGKYLRESKLDQIIWRDLYHIQKNLKLQNKQTEAVLDE
ncbi:kynurenine 3-monooxygenase [Stylonychia lemnae]|uniref:Kynurenine 3-monooxygenase n=1 Tax=Stylonychia lemnae TaxID=5949 RepID=A0A078AJJ3_STYLE|nr:kynurenine 3-monooxygenase [Stylonychia lemnae]|eukprot:CDW82530.1 kynurenine 3-monooxygenase [Stylonychia lemnae]